MRWKYVGIDGCRYGWFCVYLDDENHWYYQLVTDIHLLSDTLNQATTALIDIPIGLVDFGPAERRCDKDARRLLGRPRSSSVFPAPARKTLNALDYQQAAILNRRFTGRGLSMQTWGILPKIREVDRLLDGRPQLQGLLRESHPEVCFSLLNKGHAMKNSKKTPAGQKERLNVILNYHPAAKTLLEMALAETLRSQLAIDDILDAVICAVTARFGVGRYRTLPDDPDLDSQGNTMEIVYAES
ncbi:MAG: DUF429 domain-containing protein [Gammaproteobacteria bacterium]|nr:DUF429 domain-containing protein [Gammaproteobacteria bacterium]